jgi:apolipoprotein N-acyltransferase
MQRLTPWVLATLSGVVLAFAMPGLGLWPLALVFPGLLLEALERGGGGWRPWLLGWLAGVAHWAVATHWVHGVMNHYGGLSWIGAVGALFGMAGILALTWSVVAGLAARIPAPWRPWFFPFAWIAVDALRRFQPFQFPWNEIAVVVADRPVFLGSLPVWGASGLGWAIVAIGSGSWGLIRRQGRPAAAALLIAAVGAAIATTAIAPVFEPAGDPVRVAVLQPGTTLEEKWDPSEWQEIADRVWVLTRRASDAGAAIVVWPESAVPFRIDSDETYREIATSMARELGIEIVLNSIVAVGDGGFANSAALVTTDGVGETRYDKVHLVPFGETVPPWADLIATDALVREVGRFTPGGEVRPLPGIAPMGVAICYEVVFPGQAAASARAGAEILVTLTNDGWYGFSWAPAQHFAHVRLRAAEQRRWFARAALTGISAFVDPYGRVSERLEVGDQGFLVAEMTPSTRLTPRARWGDWWWVLCVVGTAAGLTVSEIRLRASGVPTQVKTE